MELQGLNGASAKDNDNAQLEASLSLAERARQREIQSYLFAASITPATTHLVTTEPVEPPKRSSDPSLTALVQLAALRLDTERSFLSLIHGSTHYIAAEATKQTSLASGGGVSAENDLFLGTMRMDKSWGICPKTMDFFCDTTGELKCPDPNIEANNSRYIIKNLSADPELCERPYVKNWPYFKSYLEVPIVSPSGYVLGGISVIDNKFRTFDESAIETLTEIGRTIMSHLDHVRTKNQQARSVKLIRDLDEFIQHEAGGRTPEGVGTVLSPSSKADDMSGRALSPTGEANGVRTQNLGIQQDSESVGMKMPPDPTFPTEVRSAFVRSASLIRHSLEMDGMVFLDASASLYSGRQRFTSLDNDPLSPIESMSNKATSPELCAVLATSIAGGSTMAQQTSSFTFSQGLLDRLTRRYPRGRIFSADQYGVLCGPSTPRSSQSENFGDAITEGQDRLDLNELFTHLPGASSVIFLPMWHFQKERWYAAGIGWTCDPLYLFDSRDATSLSAFGNSIMTEILRFEALAVSKAKSDFISSISHEIRSPLHGILATTELLNETIRSSEEQSMLAMIQSCGNTLLDTMNHLLEFAKINNLSQSKHAKVSEGSELQKSADLSRLIEEATVTVSAGYAFETTSHDMNAAKQPASFIEQSTLDNGGSTPPVLVTLDIQRNDNWHMPLDAGAWKRIAMNVVGNALKYTPKGTISVKLEIENGEIHFSVKDTGIGIGDDYLKYQLFTPFAQENTFSSGTGLGLAIVHQIVKGLGGRLEIQSEVGVGTTVSVIVPLSSPSQSRPMDEVYKTLAGRTMCFLEPAIFTQQKLDQNCLAYAQRLEASVSDTAKTWLGMHVVHAANPNNIQADVYVVDRSLGDVSQAAIPTALNGKPVVIITDSRLRHQTIGLASKPLRMPFGPRHLATVITCAIDNVAQAIAEPQSTTNTRITRDQVLVAPPNGILQKAAYAQLSPPPSPAYSISAASIKQQKSPSAQLQPRKSSKHNILVVDDNAINVKILTKLLDGLGCSYTTAFNGVQAVETYKAASFPLDTPEPSVVLKDNLFTLIFMDISMPVMNGFDATREIREYEKECDIQPVKVIALTGLGDEGSQRQAFSCGIDDFWTKPVKLGKVKKLLASGNANT